MRGELKPRSGPEGAGLPGAATAAQHWRGKGLAMCGLCHVLLPGSPPSSIIVIGSSFCSRGATLAMVRGLRTRSNLGDAPSWQKRWKRPGRPLN